MRPELATLALCNSQKRGRKASFGAILSSSLSDNYTKCNILQVSSTK